MSFKFVAAAAALLAGSALATPALAQDRDSGFTGPRAEAIVGWDHIEPRRQPGIDGTDGVVYGGQIGYDVQVGKAVLGAEGEITGATGKQSAQNVIVTGDRLRQSAGRDLYAGVRLGVAVSDKALVYAKGGYTNARLENSYTAGALTTGVRQDVSGFRLGAGSEVKLSDRLYAKAEYRYSKYDDNSGIHLDRHQVVGGVGIRF